MAGTLACVHKCRGAPCYQYVNPYSMIIAEDEELYFLDLKAASNLGDADPYAEADYKRAFSCRRKKPTISARVLH